MTRRALRGPERQSCAFFSTDNGLDFDDADRLFELHLQTCRRCGRRVLDNATTGFRRALVEPTLRLFMPFAIAETLVTFAFATVVAPLGTGIAMFAFALAFVGPVVFVYAQRRRLETFFARSVVPLMSLRYFRTGVGNPQMHGRHWLQQDAIFAYLRFARVATLACFGCYVVVGATFAIATSEVDIAVLHVVLGTCWAFLLRGLLATVELIDVLDVSERERAWLRRVTFSASRIERFLGGESTLTSVVQLHVVVIGAIAAAALVAISLDHGRLAVAAAFALAVAGVAVYLAHRWASVPSERPAATRGDAYTLLRG